MHAVADFHIHPPHGPARTAEPVAPAAAAATGTPLNVVFLGASSGGGHDGVARALVELLQSRLGARVQATHVDLSGGRSATLPPWMARIRYHLDGVWSMLYKATDRRCVVRACAAALRPLALRWLRSQVPVAPDVLVAVHLGAAQPLQALAASFERRPRTVVVVTDYDAHWAWFCQADLLLVASPAAAARARAAGVPDDRLLQLPLLPCRRPSVAASQPPDADRLRVVVAAGADVTSAGRLQAVLTLLDAGLAGDRLQVDVVCGRGASLPDPLHTLAGRLRRLQLRVHGCVDDLPLRLAAADLALLRASPQPLTEALAAGTPVVAFDWHAHEAANASLLARLGCGHGSRDPAAVAGMVALLALRTDDTLARWAAAAGALADAVPADVLLARLLQGLPAAEQGAGCAAA